MAACFSTSGIYSLPPIYVLSNISKLTDCLKSSSLPQTEVKPLRLPENYETDSTVTTNFNQTLKDIEILVCDCDILAKTYSVMPNLKWAHSTWAGVEPLVKQISEQPHFTLTRHSGQAFTSLIAEYVACHILNFERKTKQSWKNQESKIWESSHHFLSCRLLSELTVSILGVGNMATAVASFLKSRNAIVHGFARRPRPSGSQHYFDKVSTNLSDILPDCDYLVNTLPSTPQTSGLLNNSVLKLCNKKPVFINVGRGNIIAEAELISALKNDWVSGAALDVFEQEPLPQTSELWKMTSVVVTPHISALSKPEHIAEEFFKNLVNYVDGHGLENVVDWTAGY